MTEGRGRLGGVLGLATGDQPQGDEKRYFAGGADLDVPFSSKIRPSVSLKSR